MKTLEMKNRVKIKGCYLKITCISLGKCPSVANLVLNYANIHHVYQMIQYANNLTLIFVNIDKTMRNKRKLLEN